MRMNIYYPHIYITQITHNFTKIKQIWGQEMVEKIIENSDICVYFIALLYQHVSSTQFKAISIKYRSLSVHKIL